MLEESLDKKDLSYYFLLALWYFFSGVAYCVAVFLAISYVALYYPLKKIFYRIRGVPYTEDQYDEGHGYDYE